MRITILGTGTLAGALGGRWVRAGHEVTVTGRSADRAGELARRLGARAIAPGAAVAGADAVLLAVAWSGVAQMLASVRAESGSLGGTALIDPTNAIDHGVGALLTPPGGSGAQHIAALAPGARVVKAFHLFPASQWTDPADSPVTVAICGDDPRALDTAGTLIRDVGATPAVLGSLARARQLEEVAGFAIGLAFQGIDPRRALPGAAA
ncbi:NADPH-dependent F420 reductase [Nocardia sp. NPDC055321]